MEISWYVKKEWKNNRARRGQSLDLHGTAVTKREPDAA
jgi:hypothetical protein